MSQPNKYAKPREYVELNGKMVRRVDITYALKEYEFDKTYLEDSSGRVYKKDKAGTLRRVKGKDFNDFMAKYNEFKKKQETPDVTKA